MGKKRSMRGSEEGLFRGRGSRFEFLNNIKKNEVKKLYILCRKERVEL